MHNIKEVLTVCMYVCMYVCMSWARVGVVLQSIPELSMTPAYIGYRLAGDNSLQPGGDGCQRRLQGTESDS
ncbi:hypothetical protein F4778DRAFT_496701 [Xylariomycetidae sp. FL2044]|nr:hypothetical protein F4778DRAFT_496701 [Xylariomycetidae sp. FL2044]